LTHELQQPFLGMVGKLNCSMLRSWILAITQWRELLQVLSALASMLIEALRQPEIEKRK